MSVKPGIYQHFKGNEYEVIGLAKHSETQEELVVYKPLYGEPGLWVRPLTMFVENVDKEGQSVQRFSFIRNSNETQSLKHILI